MQQTPFQWHENSSQSGSDHILPGKNDLHFIKLYCFETSRQASYPTDS